jgi:hypothetical protein
MTRDCQQSWFVSVHRHSHRNPDSRNSVFVPFLLTVAPCKLRAQLHFNGVRVPWFSWRSDGKKMAAFWDVASCIVVEVSRSLQRGFLLMEAVNTFETSVNFNRTTRRNITEHSRIRTRRRENLRSQLIVSWQHCGAVCVGLPSALRAGTRSAAQQN